MQKTQLFWGTSTTSKNLLILLHETRFFWDILFETQINIFVSHNLPLIHKMIFKLCQTSIMFLTSMNLTKFAAAMADLNDAVRLSNGAGRTGCRALCQRGLLWRRRNAIDAAKADFALAARLGSQFARSQVSTCALPTYHVHTVPVHTAFPCNMQRVMMADNGLAQIKPS